MPAAENLNLNNNDLKYLESVEPREGFILDLLFVDGTSGQVDLSEKMGKGVFQEISSGDDFNSVKLSEDGRSISWKDMIDICADSLYIKVTGKKVFGID